MATAIIAVIALVIGGLTGFGFGHNSGYAEAKETARLATVPAPVTVVAEKTKPAKKAKKAAKKSR